MPTTHVTSLELSRRLKELNVPQNSHFWWTTDNLNFTDDKCTWLLVPTADSYARRTSAYLASELGEMLPLKYASYRFSVKQTNEVDWCCDDNKGDVSTYADTECNARAKMLIYLLENHLISVEELGK